MPFSTGDAGIDKVQGVFFSGLGDKKIVNIETFGECFLYGILNPCGVEV